MEALFLKLLNMSITAGWIVLAVIILRPFLKKTPKWISCALWALVGIRLIFPFSIESITSLIPSKEIIPQDIVYQTNPELYSGFDFINSQINPIISQSIAPSPGDSVNPLQIVSSIATWVWIIGMTIMVLYTLTSYLNLRQKVSENIILRDNIRICDHISTPFILGIIKPVIYLPSNMSGEDMEYVIAHEQAHLKRHDHWWKPLGFALLSVYWFNPLMWVAYILLCRDIEMACDEKVISKMPAEGKMSYSEALLNCSVSRKSIAACPLAFGEVGVKFRIKSVLSYKKPTLWIVIGSAVACVVVALCFMTDPVNTVSWQESGPDYNGVSINLVSAEYTDGKLEAEVKWDNHSGYAISHSETYKIYKKTDGWWTEIHKNIVNQGNRGLKTGKNYTSETSFVIKDLVQGEVYRLEGEFSISELNIEDEKVWVDFCIGSKPGKVTATPIVTAKPTILPENTTNPAPGYLSEGDFLYEVLSDNSVRVVNYTGDKTKVVIPETIDGKVVTEIYIDGEFLPHINEKVKEVTIPAGVTDVQMYKFSGWTNLETLIFKGNAPDYPDYFLLDGEGATGYISAKNITIYYNKGATGFTTPIWNGIKCAEEGEEPEILSYDDYEYVVNSDNTVTLFRYTGTDKNVKIPEKIKGKKVTSISGMCFSGSDFLSSVTIPNTVTEIGPDAFRGCTALTSVKGGKNLKTIDIQAFYGCSNLSDIALPEGLTRIGISAFAYCTGLKQINIPGTVKVVEYGTFLRSRQLEKVTFNEGTEFIEGLAFSECAIKDLKFPESMKEVLSMAFLYTPVETVKLNEGLEVIYGQAFRATEITEAVIPASVNEMHDSSFAGKVDLKFEGDAPENFISGYGLLSKESTIYYHEGAEGFTSPSWNGYKTAIW